MTASSLRHSWPAAFSLMRCEGYWMTRFVAMACPCEVLIEDTEEPLARRIASAVADSAWRIERKFSRYRNDSTVQAINRSNGQLVEVDEETAKLLDFASALTHLSKGRFDITSGVLRRAWTFDGGTRIPTQEAIDALLPLIGWHRVEWERPHLRLPEGMEIDFGGIGKEYAVDAAVELAAAIAPEVSCLVNLGGDVAASRERRDGKAWRVGVETVKRIGSAAGIIELHRGGLATSGDTRRFVVHHGNRCSHILDARTGWPVRDAPHSVTVAANTCTQAGALTTLAMLEGANASQFLAASGVKYWLQ
ncbi:MAG: FAD:protein FMN transferase [Povalibacter sp.]